MDFHHERRQVHIGSSGKEINDQFRRRKSEEDLEGQFEEVTCQTTFASTSLMHSLKIFIVKKLSKRSILSQNFIERIECQCQNLILSQNDAVEPLQEEKDETGGS